MANKRIEDQGNTVNFDQINELRERNRVLEDQNNLFQMITSIGRDLISVHDEQGGILFVSVASVDMLGYKPDELVGKSPNEWIHKADMPRVKEHQENILAGRGGDQMVVFRMKHRSGSWVWLETVASVFTSGSGERRLLASTRNVDRNMKDSQSPDKAREIQYATERLSRSGSFTLDLRKGEVYWSEGLYDLTGRSRKDGPYSKEDLKKRMSEGDFTKLIRLLQEVADSRQTLKGEFKLTPKTKAPLFLDCEVHTDPYNPEDRSKILGIVRDKTDLHRIQVSLSRSEEKFRHIFETFPDGILLSRYHTGQIIDFNPAFLRISGYHAGEIHNRSSVELTLFRDNEVRKEFFRVLGEGKTLENKELQLRGKNGKTIDVLVSSTILNLDGDPLLLSVIRDVSAIKEVERKLKRTNRRLMASEEKFSAFVSLSPDGIMMTDEKGLIQEWNSSMERLTGIPSADAVGSPYLDVLKKIHRFTIGKAPDSTLLREEIDHLLRSGESSHRGKESYERFIPGTGHLHIENYTFPIKSDKGYRIGQISRDITEQKEFERNVLLYRDIYLNNEDGIAILDVNGCYSEINPAHTEILGYKPEELAGKSPAIFLGDKLFAEIFKVYDYQSAFEGELTAKRKNGREIFIDFILFQVVSDNIPVCIVSVIRDITDRKKAEKEIIEARWAAEEADSLKTAFLSNMSHEIRTPMNAILGFSGLLENENIPLEKRKKYVEYINKNGENLLHLIDDIIDISKIESNQIKIRKSTCNLHDIVEDIYASMAKVMSREGKSRVRLVKNYADSAIWTFTDGHRLRQIMVNLIHNAIKFTDEGYIEVGYHVQGREILFYVKDTGIGIPAELKDSIFERFRKLENVKKKLYGGAGLGLAISRQLINLLGGKIWVESDIGKGTTFYFSLPHISGIKPGNGEVNAQRKDSGMIWPGKNIMIVEDDPFSFELISEYLSDTQTEYHHVSDGREAVKFFTDHKEIDLILMDIRLPGMNGYEATRLIKAVDPSVPVIAQSAFAMEEDRRMARENGCDEFLTKPLSRQELFRMLDKYLV